MKTLKIGDVKIKNQLFLAPMVEVTDLAFRLLCRKAGAGMAYTEMIYLNALLHDNKHTQDLTKTTKSDRPLGIQITGPSPELYEKAIPKLKKFQLVDINCGCPSIRITDNQSGSYLLNDPNKIGSFIKILKNNNITATAKIRLGYKNNNVIKIAKTIEHSGADALTIHSRLAFDSYKVPADWQWIKKVKHELGIPIIGNGDIDNGKKAEEMLDIADGAMIARAAIGSPQIFSQISHYLKTGKEKEFDTKQNIKDFKQYLSLAEKHKIIDNSRLKFLGSNFLKGFEGASKARAEFMSLKSHEEIKQFVKTLQ